MAQCNNTTVGGVFVEKNIVQHISLSLLTYGYYHMICSLEYNSSIDLLVRTGAYDGPYTYKKTIVDSVLFCHHQLKVHKKLKVPLFRVVRTTVVVIMIIFTKRKVRP